MHDFILTKDDKSFLSIIEDNNIFLNVMLPNNINIFSLNEIDDHVYKYVEKYYKSMGILIYPLFKHIWKNSNLYLTFNKDLNLDIITCSETALPGLRFFNIQAFDLEELREEILGSIEYKKNKIFIKDKYVLTLEAYSFLYVQLVQRFYFNEVNLFFMLGLLEASIKIGCCSIPFKQKEVTTIKNKYMLKPGKINLKSLLISNQMRVFDIWKKKQDVLITGGTGTGKTSQIPKLFWWINMWLDGINIDYDFFDYNKIKKAPIEKRSTTLSLPRKVLITSNSKFAAKSLGYDDIKSSPITCKFKDVKLTEFYNPNVYDFLSPFIFSINRNTTFNNVSTIIFDEIHEHDTYCDIGIAIVKKIKEEYNIRNLVLITATVTNDLDNLKNFFPQLVEMKIKDEYLYPIQEMDLSDICNIRNNYKDIDLIIRKYALRKNQSTLFFLPSMSSINKMEEYLTPRLVPSFFKIIKLHREAVLEDPTLVSKISQFKDNHVIILSTPIAESSITIDTAKIVIDTGLFFSKSFFAGKVIYITESMMQQRKGRVGRVSSGLYIRLFGLDKINNTFKRIDNEFLLPYVISFAPFDMEYNDFLIKPDKDRYKKTIKYYKNRGIDFSKNPMYINRIYNQFPCSLGEYIIIYMYGSDEEKKLLQELDNMNDKDAYKFITKHYSELLSIAKKINLPVSLVYSRKERNKVAFKKYFENMSSFFVQILFEKRDKYLLLKENFVLSF